MKKILFLVITVLFNTTVYAETPPRIAVLPFEAVGVSENDAITAGRLFETALVQAKAFTVVEQNRINEILEAQSFSLSGCSDENCAIEVGKLLSAEQIVMGSFFRVGSGYILNVKIIDVAQARNIQAERTSFNMIEDLPEAVDLLAERLTPVVEEPDKKVPETDEFDRYNSIISELESRMSLLSITEIDDYKSRVNNIINRLSDIEEKYPDLETRLKILLKEIDEKEETADRLAELRSLRERYVNLKTEYEKALDSDSVKNNARTFFGILTLASFGSTGVCWYLGDAAYTEYNSAITTPDAVSYRSRSELLEKLKYGSGIAGAGFSILFLVNSGEDQAPAIKKQMTAVSARISELEADS